MNSSVSSSDALRIIHVLRAPVGGLFRHVYDLTKEQIALGHHVGLITDSLTGGTRAEEIFDELRPHLELGIQRVPMHRLPHPTDLTALRLIAKTVKESAPHVLHGHGSKGGLYARLSAAVFGKHGPVRAYTPHGGSFNYYPGSPTHRAFMLVENFLERGTDLLSFESAYIAGRFKHFVHEPRTLSRIVWNGISECEYQPVEPNADAADFVYIGELRAAKGIDTLLDAMFDLKQRNGHAPSLVLVGAGPDEHKLAEQAKHLGLAENISFPGILPAREAFRLGRAMVVPSRAESLPYVILEAAGAQIPLLATNVGGVCEIFGPYTHRLIKADDHLVLAEAMDRMMNMDADTKREEAQQLADFVATRFTLRQMVDGVISGYREAMALRNTGSTPVLEHAKSNVLRNM